MALTPGTRLGPYEVTTQIGVGGMGEVYKATDTNLKRAVAIKVLPASVAGDADRLARFQREAEVLAALNHPNIAQIHGLEKSDGITALVMELVEGPTLADRIGQGAISIDEALPIAKQIAEALEAAHEQGIIHRDLKPANIKVRSDGTVKVLDFGLAKAMEPAAGSSPSMSMSPTITTPAMTQAGMILGTAAYMSPEQAAGKPVDKRSDLWAFGVVVFEMLTGRPVFTGETVSHILASVLTSEPDWTALPAATPTPIRRLLRRCLEKDRKRRLDSAAAARIEIEDALTAPAAEVSLSAVAPRRGRERLAWLFAFAVVILIAVAAMLWTRRPVPLAPETRLEIVTPATTDPLSFALSPDGHQIVFVASSDGPSRRLWLRSLAATSAQPLAGTDGALFPFWSPDSRSVAFFADGKLKRLDLGVGQLQTLAAATTARGGTWNRDGVLLYPPTTTSPLFRVSASGGQPVAVTKLDRQASHRFPAFLPDGHHFLFYAQGPPETSGIYLGSLDAPATTRLTAADTGGVYLPSGWLAWVRGGTLVARRLDLTRGALTGDPVTVADPVGFDSGSYAGGFSVSSTGVMAYRSGAANRRQLTWFDRSGKALGTFGAPDESSPRNPRLSPDGHWVAVWRTVQGNADVWLLDGTRMNRFTFDPGADRSPVWSPDGHQIVFESTRKGHRDLYRKPSNGVGSEELLLESSQDKVALDWSADGRFLLYQSNDPQTGWDLWVLPMLGDRKPWVFLKTTFNERAGQFSPDGRWVAYMSNESGRQEVYVRPFVDLASARSTGGEAGAQWQVSTAGGIYARWRPDGKELDYLGPDGRLMAAPIAATATTLEPGTPVALFQTHVFGGGADAGQDRQYDVVPDGRFLINTVLDDAAVPITLLMNWNPEAKE